MDDVPLAGQDPQFLAELLDRVAIVLGLFLGLFRDRLFRGLFGGLGLRLGGVVRDGVVRDGVGSLDLGGGLGVLAVRALDGVELVLDGLDRLDGVVHVRVRHGGCFFLDT